MKKFIILLTFIVSVIASSNLFAQTASILSTGEEYSRNGNTFSSITKSKQEPELTPYTWKDSKGNEYPIYISASGSCYVIKTSKKTGKEYKSYLPKEVSAEICKELGKEYKGKQSNNKNNE